ncbi:MAG: penicillin-binding protein 1B [Pseudomonadales bacterium]|nr:penicillin-binding protein 1B [Pseudomonadales bacterium]
MSSNESNGKKRPQKKKAASRKKSATKKSAAKKSAVKPKASKAKTATKRKSAVSKKTANKKRQSKNKAAKTTFLSMTTIAKMAVVVLLIFGGYLIYLDAIIQSKFAGKRWQVPAKVYSRPLEIFSGANVSRAQLLTELKQLHYQQKTGAASLGPGSYRVATGEIQLHSRGFEFWDGSESANQITVRFHGDAIADVVVNKSSDEIARLEPQLVGGIYPAHNEDRVLVTLDQVPSALIGALIAVEDRDFYEHWGVSIRGIVRAMFANIKAGGLRQGGSTLTQQLVKNFYLTSERSLTRKINEALMAVLLEFHYEKDAILEAYLNEVYLAQAGQRSIHGFGLGSLYYFGVPLRELKVEQIALLVGLVKGPSWYDPRRHPQRAKERRDQVLALMVDQGVMGQSEFERVKNRPLSVIAKPVYDDERFPAFMNLVRQQLQQDYKDEDLRSEGLRIFTTLDPFVQQQLQQQTQNHLVNLAKGYGSQYQNLQMAAIFTAANTGEVVALLGDKNPRFKGFNRALNAYRPIGSLIKPAVYLAALEQGYTLATLVEDEPIEIATPNGEIWRPENFEKVSHGPVIMQQALAQSYNQATARVATNIGIDKLTDMVKRLGVNKNLPEVPALSLGAVSLSPYEVATMYQTFAASGFYTPLRAIRSVLGGDGKPLQRYGIDVDKRLEPAYAYLITVALQEVVNQGTAKTAKLYLPEDLAAAGKTGTSDEQRDAWFAGWTGAYLGVVWVGFDENQPTTLTGASGALPIWAKTMAQLPQSPLNPLQPDNVEWYWVDPLAMALAKSHCEGAVFVPLVEATVPETHARCDNSGRVFNWIKNLFE